MGLPPPIETANLGMADSLILMVLALVVFGPRRLPQIGRQIGKLMYEFRKASNDFKFQMEEELRNAEEADRRKNEEERQRTPELTAPSQSVEAPLSTDATSPVAIDVTESLYSETTQDSSLTLPDTSPDETYPSIQPPSIDEQVPAARPTAQAGVEVNDRACLDSILEAEAAPVVAADEAHADKSGTEVSPATSGATEQAAHND